MPKSVRYLPRLNYSRIDSAADGWKGRGLWVTSGDRTPWLKEDGAGSKPLIVHFQVRSNPLEE